MSVHARCPCSRASVAELGEIAGRSRGRLLIYVLIVPAPGEAALDSAVGRAASAIPGVRVVADDGGARSRAFGALTSGHAALFDAAGRLRFAGGITGARGHAGDNEGRASVLALLADRPASSHTPVFGCPLSAEGRPE